MDNNKLTQQISHQYKPKPALFQNEFRNQKGKVRILCAYNDHILIQNKNKAIVLNFETKFQVIRDQVDDKRVLGRPLGIALEKENCKHIPKYFNNDVNIVKQWRDYLSQLINQRQFHESFKAHKKIGKGNFASVYLADRLEDGKAFAIKAFSKEVAYGQDKGRESIKNEIQIMRQLNSPSLIRLHEVYETENSLYMVLDLLEGGSLYDKIKNRPQFNSMEIELLMKNLLEGLQAMHAKRLMHRDLKPENILFRKPNQISSVCIADFGLATNADEQQYLFTRCGTPGFVAPEIVNSKDNNAHYDPVCDVFSVGLIFYILLTGKPAFPGKSYNDVLQRNRKCDITFDGPLFDNVPGYAYDLLRKMLEREPLKRITSQLALQHPYFTRRAYADLTVTNDEEEGITRQFANLQEEYIFIIVSNMKFDMARHKQILNSPCQSPIIVASSRLKNNELQSQSPLITGKTDSLQSSPNNSNFNSPSLQPREKPEPIQIKPSRFKLDQGPSSGQNTPKIMKTEINALHKYAIQNEMQKKMEIQRTGDSLRKNI